MTEISTPLNHAVHSMRFVTFDPFRALGIPGASYIKPAQLLRHRELIQQADGVLFPDYWQVNTLHYGWGVRIFPSIAAYHLGHDKIEMTRVFEALVPGNTPLTLILSNTADNQQQVLDTLSFPWVAKTPKSSQGAGVFLIENRSDWRRYCDTHEVLYAQEFLPAPRDLRLVVIGGEVVGGYWREHPEGGFHNNVARGGRIVHDPLPLAAVELVTRLARQLRIDHAGFDVMMCEGHPYLLEFNRLFGNQGLVEQGIQPARLIHAYLETSWTPGRPRPWSPLRQVS